MEDSALLRIKRGYLKDDFKLFHLKDRKAEEHGFHYHDFNKIVVFLSGNVTYVIEGKYYRLKPWDILFVSSNELHKPIIDPNEYYERIIIWVNSNFLEAHSSTGSELLTCFHTTEKERLNLFRSNAGDMNIVKDTLFSLEKAIRERDFGDKLLQNSYFIQLVIYLNRLMLRMKTKKYEKDISYDERVISIISYVNKNLDGDLSVDAIATRFYMNRYYLMHNFKDQTGYTLHSYIQQKRLALGAALLKKGLQAAIVSEQCGFQDYSSFVRAFKKNFGLSPKQYYKAIKDLQQSHVEEAFENLDHYPFRE